MACQLSCVLLAVASALAGVATPVAHRTGICNPTTTEYRLLEVIVAAQCGMREI
jgi:hypothetical protein